MKNSTKKNVVSLFVIAISLVFILCILFASQKGATTQMPISHENFDLSPINPASIKLNNGYYNSSTAITCIEETNIQKFFVYTANSSDIHATNKTLPDVLVYFNGTAVNPNQINYDLKSGDNLQVNFLIPAAKYAPKTLMSITIYTLQALYVTSFSINWID